MRTPIALAAVSLLIACTESCAGSAARQEALWPAVVSAWPGVRADVQRGIELDPSSPLVPDAQVAVAAIDAAVEADDREMLGAIPWSPADALARAGIQARVDAGDLSEGVAASLTNRLAKFAESLREVSK